MYCVSRQRRGHLNHAPPLSDKHHRLMDFLRAREHEWAVGTLKGFALNNLEN